MKHEHPYQQFEGTPLWEVIEKAVTDLEENQDLNLTTAPVYVIGYICKELAEQGISVNLHRH